MFFECRGCIFVNSSVGETLQPDKGKPVSLLLQKPKAEPLNSITPSFLSEALQKTTIRSFLSGTADW